MIWIRFFYVIFASIINNYKDFVYLLINNSFFSNSWFYSYLNKNKNKSKNDSNNKNNIVINIISCTFLGIILYLFVWSFKVFNIFQIFIFSLFSFAIYMFISDKFKLSNNTFIQILQKFVFINSILVLIGLILYLFDFSIFDTVFCDNDSDSVYKNSQIIKIVDYIIIFIFICLFWIKFITIYCCNNLSKYKDSFVKVYNYIKNNSFFRLFFIENKFIFLNYYFCNQKNNNRHIIFPFSFLTKIKFINILMLNFKFYSFNITLIIFGLFIFIISILLAFMNVVSLLDSWQNPSYFTEIDNFYNIYFTSINIPLFLNKHKIKTPNFNLSLYFNKFITILYNIISLNKLPIKQSFIYFVLILVGVISSLIVRSNYITVLTFSDNSLICIRIFSIFYSLYILFNFIIITVHAFNLITFFLMEKMIPFTLNNNNNINILIIGYYTYYCFIAVTTVWLLLINYHSFLYLNFLHIYFYIGLIFLIFILAFYFILKKKINFSYDINKKIGFTGKIILVSIFSFFLAIYVYNYMGGIFKFINIVSPFKFIYCESTSSQAQNELNNLSGNNNTFNNNNSNNNFNNTSVPSQTTNINLNSNNSQYLDSRSSTPTPRTIHKTDKTMVFDNRTSKSKFPNWKFDLPSNSANKTQNDLINYLKICDNMDMNSMGYFFNDAFYSDIDILINNDDSLITMLDAYMVELSHTKSFSICIENLQVLIQNEVIDNIDAKRYLDMIITTTEAQGSDEREFLNWFKSVMMSRLNNNIRSLPDMVHMFNNRIMYLNGNYSFIKSLQIVNEVKDFKLDFKGTNLYSLGLNLETIIQSPDFMEHANYDAWLTKILFEQTKLTFYNKYAIEFSELNYYTAINNNLYNDIIFNNYLYKRDNLIFQYRYDIFRFRFNYNGKEKEIIYNCDSLFKLRCDLINRQNKLISDYKDICKFYNYNFKLLNTNQLLESEVFKLIQNLDDKFNFIINSNVSEETLNRLSEETDINKILTPDQTSVDPNNENYYLLLKKYLLKLIKKQYGHIALQHNMRHQIPGLDRRLIENRFDHRLHPRLEHRLDRQLEHQLDHRIDNQNVHRIENRPNQLLIEGPRNS